MTKLEKVLKDLGTLIDYWDDADRFEEHVYGANILNTLTDARTWIEDTLKEREWVSAKDRLPDGDGELFDGTLEQSNIVTLYGKDPYGRKAFGIGRWIYNHMNTKNSGWNGVMDDDWEASLCTITHWMPMPKEPEPPKEGE